MKSKVKEKIKHTIHNAGLEELLKYYVMRHREKHYITLSEQEKIEELKKWYFKHTGKKLDLEKPSGFNEKIQWLKLFDFKKEKTLLSDKYLVREWVKEKIGENYLIPIYGAWDEAKKINFESLPNEFVLKANHGSGMNLVVRDKSKLNYEKVIKRMNYWLKTPYDLSGMEQQYFSIPRKIIAEKYIEQKDGNLLDYKIHCFNGEPKLVQVIGDRNLENHTAKEAFFDIDWNSNEDMYRTYQKYEQLPNRPEKLKEMLEIAKKLSEGFIYVRVDLYFIEDKIKFGEMTFTPASGIGQWNSAKSDKLLGDWIKV